MVIFAIFLSFFFLNLVSSSFLFVCFFFTCFFFLNKQNSTNRSFNFFFNFFFNFWLSFVINFFFNFILNFFIFLSNSFVFNFKTNNYKWSPIFKKHSYLGLMSLNSNFFSKNFNSKLSSSQKNISFFKN